MASLDSTKHIESSQATGSTCQHSQIIKSDTDIGDERNGAAQIPLVEFAVNLRDEKDLQKLDAALKKRGVKVVSSDLEDKTVQVQFAGSDGGSASDALDVQSLQKYVEQETGFLAVIKGMGHLAAAVAELRPSPASDVSAFGVVRLSQMTDGSCFVDGLIDGAGNRPASQSGRQTRGSTGRVSLAIHEFGDLSSDNYDSIGKPTVEIVQMKQADSELPPLPISIQRIVPYCDVAQQIGKSIALRRVPGGDQAQVEAILTAGVIARASTIEANKKQVCSCSGKTLWQERAERQKGAS